APAPAAEAGAATATGACDAARRDWLSAASVARRALGALEACLAKGPPCAQEMVGVRAALAEVAAQGQRIAWLCEGARWVGGRRARSHRAPSCAHVLPRAAGRM